MKIHFSDFFEIDPEDIEKYGAFNISLINDLPLFIDPFLLFNSTKEEYKLLHSEIIHYIAFLRDQATSGRIDNGLLRSWYEFPEVKQNWLGFSRVGNSGAGLGSDFANALFNNLHELFKDFGGERITRGSHLEKLCLIKEGVGKDKISDFTANLIKQYLLQYTQEFGKRYLKSNQRKVVAVSKVRFNYQTRSWESGHFELPYQEGDYIILTPKDILTKEDTWINKADLIHDFDDIVQAIPNDQLRAQLSHYLHSVLPEKPKEADIREARSKVVAKYPQIVDYFIRYKEENGGQAISLSEQRVKEIENVFFKQLREFVSTLENSNQFYPIGENTYEEAKRRVLFLKDIIENKGGHKLFFVNGEPIRRESDLQILFRLTWYATPSDISREVNDGRGPVDFKVSRGSKDKSLVEFKLAKNTHLKRNLEKQLAIYERASDAKHSLSVILFFSEEELIKVNGILKELGLQKSSDIILIDASSTNKPSGSKA
ncbi:MAG: hypothetical protein HY751_13825 [Nitrospinae bacterium]|nr:hypothetical protein [Nitrospinota bacterium]